MPARTGVRSALTHACRLYPLKSGATRFVQRPPLSTLAREPEVTTARLRDGQRLVVNVSDLVGRTVFYFGDYDPKITWVCETVLRPGDTMLDVGANVGSVSTYASKFVGPNGAVHSFEPQPPLVERLNRSIATNGSANITVHGVALSDSEGELPLFGFPGNDGSASLNPDPHPRLVEMGTVPVRHSGNYLDGLGLAPIRLLKIDVEGHEEPFFRGAEQFLAQNTPDVVVFESHGDEPFFERPVVKILSGLGYEFRRLPKAKLRVTLHPISPDEPMSSEHGFDFVAVQPAADLPAALR